MWVILGLGLGAGVGSVGLGWGWGVENRVCVEYVKGGRGAEGKE